MVATWVRPCTAPGVAATRQHRETSSPGRGREQTLRRRALRWFRLTKTRLPSPRRASPRGCPRPWGHSWLRTCLGGGAAGEGSAETFKPTPNGRKEGKRRAGGGEGTRSARSHGSERGRERPAAAGRVGKARRPPPVFPVGTGCCRCVIRLCLTQGDERFCPHPLPIRSLRGDVAFLGGVRRLGGGWAQVVLWSTLRFGRSPGRSGGLGGGSRPPAWSTPPVGGRRWRLSCRAPDHGLRDREAALCTHWW